MANMPAESSKGRKDTVCLETHEGRRASFFWKFQSDARACLGILRVGHLRAGSPVIKPFSWQTLNFGCGIKRHHIFSHTYTHLCCRTHFEQFCMLLLCSSATDEWHWWNSIQPWLSQCRFYFGSSNCGSGRLVGQVLAKGTTMYRYSC
jgi:hypothetical protein